MDYKRSLSLLLALAASYALAAPGGAEAQILKKIKEQTERRLEARKAKADSAAIARVGKAVDSTLEKTGRGVSTIVDKAAGVAETVVARTEQSVADAASRLRNAGGSASDQLASDLAAGRAVLPEIRFEGHTDQLTAASAPHIAHLAKLLEGQPTAFLIEGHVEATMDAAADLSLSEKRAAAVKASLVAARIPATRLFVMGLGSTRPTAVQVASQVGAGVGSNARIEVARMQ
ncbi:MAG: OmpA family protein [Anaerolineae bacterium]|nr:OmpA family protein [Gemmatimonadaceae bacterium]